MPAAKLDYHSGHECLVVVVMVPVLAAAQSSPAAKQQGDEGDAVLRSKAADIVGSGSTLRGCRPLHSRLAHQLGSGIHDVCVRACVHVLSVWCGPGGG